MTPERWHQVKELFRSALEHKTDERAAFLERACDGDDGLRREVESLLASFQESDSIIEMPVAEAAAELFSGNQSESLVGQPFGHYETTALLGEGGMGAVYLARDTKLGRQVALKLLPAYFTSDADRLRRFQQEACAASALNHPNILTIYEIGETDGTHFIATEFIEGETLRERMAGAPMKFGEVLNVAEQVASALAAAHEAGIIHRDIKPENIMVRRDALVKVLDFGIAKLIKPPATGTEATTRAMVKTDLGVVMGTVQYMSPEQARGLGVDARTDIWSLGVVLYEMLARGMPFAGETSSDVIASILDRKPIALARYAPDIPPELEWIVEKTLRKDREERYQTTKELLTDLRNLKRRLEFVEDLDHSDSGQRSRDPARRPGSGSHETSHVKAQSTGSQSHSVIDSLAILPFANSSSDPSMDYFCDGISESMINALSQLSELRVMAWSTVSRHRSMQIDPRRAASDLGVRAVLTGRVMQLGDRLVIKTELVDATDGSHLWGESYRCNPSDILDVEAEISTKLSEKLLLRLTTEERKRLTKRYTDNAEAYQLYLKGRYQWHRFTDEGLRKAREYFWAAIELDPNYALAYAGLADTYSSLGAWEAVTLAPKEAMPRAKAAAMKALELDDDLAEAHASLGYVLIHNWDWPQAEKEFMRAIELNPNYANAHHWYSHYLTAVGRTEESLAESLRALELDPLDREMGLHLTWHYYHARQNDLAIAEARKMLDMEPNSFEAQYFLGWAYEQSGRYAEAITEFQRAIGPSGDRTLIQASLGHAYAASGARDKAKKVLDDLMELSTKRYVSPYDIAMVYVGLAEKDQALSWLEKAYQDRSGWLAYLRVEPRLDSLRSEARFVNLLGRIGLAQTETLHSAKQSSEKQTTEIPPEEGLRLSAGVDPSQSWWSGRAAKIFLAAGIVVVAGLGYFLWQFGRGTREATAPRNLSFTQLTDQPGLEFFPSLSPDGKSLAYTSRASGNWDIYLQRVGGRNPINLTKDSSADDSQPAFSPDGERIAFRSERDGGGIYLMGATGESITRVSEFGYSPSWSPDGAQLLVGTEKIPQPSTKPTKSHLWVIDIKSNQPRLLSEGDALQPTYSPHKYRIAYWSRPSKAGQREDIWTIPADGGEAVRITRGSTIDLNPVWSPDGKYLYFSSNRGGSMNVWRVAIDEKSGATLGEPEPVTTIGAATSALHLSFSRDGKRLAYIAQEDIRNLRKVAFDPTTGKVVGEPIWITRGSLQLWFPEPSPDGEWLAACSRGQQRHVHIMRTDGTDLRDLTDDNFRNDGWPRWSPDGKRIAFTSRRTGDYELWVINRDGSGLRKLTESKGGHYSPWSPDGTIAYSIHTPKNDCVIIQPDKAWSDQKLTYLPSLDDASISFEGWAFSGDGKKLAGIRHLPNGSHSGIGIYDQSSGGYDWFTDFGDWPVWLRDNRRLLFVSQGKILLLDTTTRKYQEVLTVTDQDVDIGSPSLSPDNRVVYFTFVAAEADIWLMTFD